MDEDELDAIRHNKLLREEIVELEATVATKERDAQNTANPILRGRLLDVINKLTQELEMKRRQLKPLKEEKSDLAQQQNGNVMAPQQNEETNDGEGDGDGDGDNDNEEDEDEEDEDVESLFS